MCAGWCCILSEELLVLVGVAPSRKSLGSCQDGGATVLHLGVRVGLEW